MTRHGFYIALAYGVSAVLLLGELVGLWRRARAARQDAQQEVQHKVQQEAGDAS